MAFNLSQYTVKEEHGARWLKLFYHCSTGYKFFGTVQRANYNINEPSLYSILRYIPYVRRPDPSKFEFLLEYPGNQGYNRWAQTKEPHTIKSPFIGDIGFEPINLTWEGYLFSGIALSNHFGTFMDCCVNDTLWHYAIGQIAEYENHQDYITGPCINFANKTVDWSRTFDVHEVMLWIRVKDFYRLFNYPCTCQCVVFRMVNYIISLTLLNINES